MSQTPDVPKLISARRTESLDAPNILSLVTSSTDALFGRTNIVNLIERALLAITLSNEQDELLAHGAFLDYPNVADIDPADWLDWLTTYFTANRLTPVNTLFMHYFVSKPDYAHGCACEVIRTMFNAIPDVHYCVLAVPAGVSLDDSLSELFTPIPTKSESRPGNCELYLCLRHEHVPVLHIREARVEDHDDLTPIFNRQTDMLSQTYGEYFLAELIASQHDDMKCLVAEVEGVAIGFMSLCTEINVDLLNKCFELAPFHGLHVQHADDITTEPPAEPVQDDENAESEISMEDSYLMTPPEVSKNDVRTNDIFGSDDVVVKRKLSEDQHSTFSDHTVDQSAYRIASERQLSAAKNSAASPIVRHMFTKPADLYTTRHRFVPEYHGRCNAFSIQLFCIDERYETRSCDFLPKAFQLFSNFDFCIITVPHLVPEFPLLQQFVRVTPRVPSTLSQELYVFGAAGLEHGFTVRQCSGDTDCRGIKRLAQTLLLGNQLLTDLEQYNKSHRDDDGTELQVFVAEVKGQIVGVAILRREEGIEYIRSHYNIEDFIYFNHHRREEHGHLYHYALNPVFKRYSKVFLKEILRQGYKTCLYYPVYPAYLDMQILSKHSLVTALNDLVPVHARRQIVYPVDLLGVNAPSERILQVKEQFALNHVNRKLVLEPKVTLNVRVVVVGASDVGIAFLETFIFCPHLRFNNLTLISPHGLPGQLPPNSLRDHLISTSHCYSQEEYDQMALRTWVNVVCGKMTAIDRHKKHVVVNGNFVVPYDYLILCTGTQYQIPTPTGLDVTTGATNCDVSNPLKPQPRLHGRIPNNAFIVNDAYDAAVALYWIEHNLIKPKAAVGNGKVIVYGSSIDVFCCVQVLLDIGLTGNHIVIVQPPTDSQVNCFSNEDTAAAVMTALKDAGVEVHYGYILARWNDATDNNVVQINSASFTSEDKSLVIECVAFFSYYTRMVDYEAFSAMNCACLVYDGRLVIDSNFHTNDPSIRAAGPLTKYQRIFHTTLTHADFNSKEIGVQLAGSLLALFDPTIESEKERPEEPDIKLVPMYRSPKICGGVLPGGYHYLHVKKPATIQISLRTLADTADTGRELITGTCGGTPEYFCIHINRYNSVDAVTCLSKTPFATSNLLALYGMHERFLNNLVSRYYEGMITDLYSYFQQPWAMAIFHDRFLDFRDEIRELLISRPTGNEESLEETIRLLMENDSSLTEGQKNMLRTRYIGSGSKRAVETHLLNFLSYNYYHLPMYAKPGMV